LGNKDLDANEPEMVVGVFHFLFAFFFCIAKKISIAGKTLSLRMSEEDYVFAQELAKEEKKDLYERGRILEIPICNVLFGESGDPRRRSRRVCLTIP
jgi:hypothetical protein